MSETDQKHESENYSEAETEVRREAALRRMLATPHKPHKPTGLTPPKTKKSKPKP